MNKGTIRPCRAYHKTVIPENFVFCDYHANFETSKSGFMILHHFATLKKMLSFTPSLAKKQNP